MVGGENMSKYPQYNTKGQNTKIQKYKITKEQRNKREGLVDNIVPVRGLRVEGAW